MDLIARHLNSTENMQAESNGLPNIAPVAAAFQIGGNFLSSVSIIYVDLYTNCTLYYDHKPCSFVVENRSLPESNRHRSAHINSVHKNDPN